MLQFFAETIRYRELIWALALKDLRVRYKRSVLGFFWALLQPLLMMVILTVVFSTFMRLSIENYAVFLIAALLPWTFFSQSLSYAAEAIVGNGELLKKLYIPKSVFPVAAMLANLINFFLSMIPLVLLLLILRFPFHLTWLYLPVPIIGLMAFTLGFCFFCSAVNVFFRDMAHIIQIVLSAWFYFSPVIYPLDLVPQKYYLLFRLNPLLYIINGFRMAIYHGMLPTVQSAAMSLGCGIFCFAIGYLIFRKYQDDFVYYL